MCNRLTHKSPDSSRTKAFLENNLRMGARRLAIVDIKGGQQLITNESGSVAVVFNSEIYNHRELREELESAGHKFTTGVDTEVLVHLWRSTVSPCPSTNKVCSRSQSVTTTKRCCFWPATVWH